MTSSNHAHTHTHSHVHDERRLFWAMLLTGGFMVVEVVGGMYSGSLALLADAGHMLTDTASLALAWYASHAARRPADNLRTYGYQRLQVLAAFINSIAFIAIVVWIAYEALLRLLAPNFVAGQVMLGVAFIGLLVNLIALFLLHGGEKTNLNLRGALLHVLGDLLGSAAVIVAAVIILYTGWMPIDPLLSILVALLILRSAWTIVRHSTHILLEGTPEEIDVEKIQESLIENVPEVKEVHHVHVWSLTTEYPLLTLHVTVDRLDDYSLMLNNIKTILVREFNIRHSTVQIEPAGDHTGSSCPDIGS